MLSWRPPLSYSLSLRPLFCLFLSDPLRQVLLYRPSMNYSPQLTLEEPISLFPLSTIPATNIGPDKQHFFSIQLLLFSYPSAKTYFGCSKQLSQWDGLFEHPQHIFWLRNENIFLSSTHSYLETSTNKLTLLFIKSNFPWHWLQWGHWK